MHELRPKRTEQLGTFPSVPTLRIEMGRHPARLPVPGRATLSLVVFLPSVPEMMVHGESWSLASSSPVGPLRPVLGSPSRRAGRRQCRPEAPPSEPGRGATGLRPFSAAWGVSLAFTPPGLLLSSKRILRSTCCFSSIRNSVVLMS